MLKYFALKRLIDVAPAADKEDTDTALDVYTLDMQPLEPFDLDSNPIKPVRWKVGIPHLDNTLHDVTTVSGMDRQTKSMYLNLAQIEWIWRCRIWGS
jgi:hypothetical protein